MGEQSGNFFIINIIFSFALVMIGLMFLEGIWQMGVILIIGPI